MTIEQLEKERQIGIISEAEYQERLKRIPKMETFEVGHAKTLPVDFVDAVVVDMGNGKTRIYQGLTKREYFAAMAMQAIISNIRLSDGYLTNEGHAKMAVEYSDALINALNESKQ